MTSKKRHPVQVYEDTYQMLREIARDQNTTMTQVAARAIEHFRRELMLQTANAQWAAILKDHEAAAEHRAEQDLWDSTLADGLDESEW